MRKKNYNKYGEYIGKTIITKKQIDKQVLWLGWSEFIINLILTAIMLPILIIALSYVLGRYKQALTYADQMLKYQFIGQNLFYLLNIIFVVGLLILFVGMTVNSLIKAIKIQKGGYFVDIDDVNYLDVVVKGTRRHRREYLVIYFYKYGRYETSITFNNAFAEHKEKFYLVLTKGEIPRILKMYRFSKYDLQE